MFKKRRQTNETNMLEDAEYTVLNELKDAAKAGETALAKSYADIYNTLTSTDKPNQKKGMSDTVKVALISAGTSLLGIIAVIRHEELNVIATKAMGLVTKAKI